MTEENKDIGTYDVVFTSTSDYHANPVLTQTQTTTVTISPCVIVSFVAIETPEEIEIVLKDTNPTYFSLPTFVQTPACGYAETWSYSVVWNLEAGVDFADLHDDPSRLEMEFKAIDG